MPPNTEVAQGRGRWEQDKNRAPIPARGICHPSGFILKEPLGNEFLIPALGGSGISQEPPGCLTTSQKLEQMGS